ncbi:discoidin domain-containing protein [Bacillus sp. B-jedd]|uniref:discoidin domain-containing protein n=1 Tax=Bacillus sp. B-jedd TaxID=1476857 RepID=UPI000515594B|nr:discoidin domain-containing protein [Bacillus sp. B-jedd]CEG28829.1 Beta-hexosaminidase [Bacillus sp. B-jedd]
MRQFKKDKLLTSIFCVCLLLVNLLGGQAVFAEESQAPKTQASFNSAKEVLKAISHLKPNISSNGKAVVLPESPDPKYEVSLYGSDNKQIIGMDLNFYEPLTDMQVNVLYKVTNKDDAADAAVSEKDIPISVKGKYSVEKGDNPVPNVIPGLREWKGSQGDYLFKNSTKLIIDKKNEAKLREPAEVIQDYFKNMLGKDVRIKVDTKPTNGDIFLTLDEANTSFGKEGYLLEIGNTITITASEPKGVLYGGTSITQILYQSPTKDTIPKGVARDYPKYEIRSGMIDVGRMYIPLEYVEEMTKYMAWFKLSEMHMHINDFRAGANYEAFRVESKKYPEINAKDGYYTQEEYIAYQKNMKKYGIDIVTEIDTPYHAESFRAVNPDLMRSSPRGYLDITTPEKRAIVYPFIESLLDEFLGKDINDPNRVFLSDQFHIGTDEYDKKYSEEMRDYTDHFINYVNDKGYRSRLWGSIGKNGFNGVTPVSSEATMNIWAPYWSDVKEMYDLGYDIINTNGTDLYIVPLGNAGFPDYLNIKAKYETFEVNKFLNTKSSGLGSAEMPLAHPQTKGAAVALWNDLTAYTGGLSSFDIFDRYKDAVMLIAEKTWYGEKTEGQNSDEFMERVKAVQHSSPLANPARFVESASHMVVKYDFEKVKGKRAVDLSGNGYDAVIHGGAVVDGKSGKALKLDGKSYLELPFQSVGFPYSVQFDIKLDKGSLTDATLFTGEDGSLYLNFNDTGKIGYERNEKTSDGSKTKFENYAFTHDYALPEEEWHHVILVGDNRETNLFVDGKKVSTSRQYNKLEGRSNDSSTFVLPVEKIGFGVKGTIDNLEIMNKGLENSLQKNLAIGQKATASSEYDSSQRASFMVDGNSGTRWSSNYRGKTEAQKDDEWIMIELDDSYDLNMVKIFWETARAKEYKLLASNDGVNFEEVHQFKLSSSDGSIDTINLKGVEAKYLKVDMDKRNTTYGYSIFEVEIYGNTGFEFGQKWIDEAEHLLNVVPEDASGAAERDGLLAAKDELKKYLAGEERDYFTFDVLVGKLLQKLDAFKVTISAPVNVAAGKTATASTEYSSAQAARLATDGNITTRWGSVYKGIPAEQIENQWLMVELGEAVDFDTVVIQWESARAAKYDLLVSNDGVNFEKVHSYTHDGSKRLADVIHVKDLNAKFVKVAMSKRATSYGYSIYELEVYSAKKASERLAEAKQLLAQPEDPAKQTARTELQKAVGDMEGYFTTPDKQPVNYHTLTKTLEEKIAAFKG